ncbi:MAG: NaeI family type II restriction endonuclease [Chthoniobacter sp.]|uniref:NaeI family type II restriction endonuclease n=1 Tax=Chthoniobacter sp. TaxID=2510640 RepID=UPI0032A2ABE4
MSEPVFVDDELEAVCAVIRNLDPQGFRTARVLRDTLDQVYNGQLTGRYRWSQLYNTEKAGIGMLVKINLHREFKFRDGFELDYFIAQSDVGCQFSHSRGTWIITPEFDGQLCLLIWADDKLSAWRMGVCRADVDRLNIRCSCDRNATLNEAGRFEIAWIFKDEPLPPNALLQIDGKITSEIMRLKSNQLRVNELFRHTLGMRLGRGVISTVAQEEDYMKRVRGNTGARTALQPEGIVILEQYDSHRAIARALGAVEPGHGELVPLRIVPAKRRDPHTAEIAGRLWRIAKRTAAVVSAPSLPNVSTVS